MDIKTIWYIAINPFLKDNVFSMDASSVISETDKTLILENKLIDKHQKINKDNLEKIYVRSGPSSSIPIDDYKNRFSALRLPYDFIGVYVPITEIDGFEILEHWKNRLVEIYKTPNTKILNQNSLFELIPPNEMDKLLQTQ